jgi:hypothetical protein
MNKLYFVIIPILFIFGCDKIPSGVSDPKPDDYQVLKIVAPDVFIYNQNDSSFATTVRLDNVKNISAIWLNYFSSDGNKLNNDEILLEDNGNIDNGDTIKGDNVFSAKLSLSKYNPIGQYLIEYYITDNSNNTIKVGIHNFQYYNGQQNYPPIISNLTAPDTIHLINKQIIITISLEVTDYNGQNDIKQVFFNSYLPPDGRPSSQNPILLYDNGTNGDKIPNDGIYTVIVQLPATGVATGVYRWEFQAMDRSDSLSNKIIHNVVIL